MPFSLPLDLSPHSPCSLTLGSSLQVAPFAQGKRAPPSPPSKQVLASHTPPANAPCPVCPLPCTPRLPCHSPCNVADAGFAADPPCTPSLATHPAAWRTCEGPPQGCQGVRGAVPGRHDPGDLQGSARQAQQAAVGAG